MCPVGLPLIILVECRFVVCDKNEMRVNARADGMRKGIAIVVPLIEACFIFLPACNERILIFHHILSLMTINIHPTLFLFYLQFNFFNQSQAVLSAIVGLRTPTCVKLVCILALVTISTTSADLRYPRFAHSKSWS